MSGLGRVSLRRRIKSAVGMGILGLGAFGALAVLAWLLYLIVVKGSPAVFDVGPGWHLRAASDLAARAPFTVIAVLGFAAVVALLAFPLRALLARAAWRNMEATDEGRGILAALGDAAAALVRFFAAFPAGFVGAFAAVVVSLSAPALALVVPLVPALLAASRAARQLHAGPPSVPPGSTRKRLVRAVAPAVAWMAGVLVVLQLAASVVDVGFLTDFPSRDPERAGVLPAIVGTLFVGFASMLVAIPIGIAAAVYLNEFARHNRMTSFLRASIANLAGVPSVVFGILGLALFVRAMQLGSSIVSAGLTLGLLTLPIVIVVSEEALKSVPRAIREAAYGLGASPWQVVRHHVLPYSLPGMLTGSILALSRTMGETAPLILIGAVGFTATLPQGPKDAFTVLPIQAYSWATRPQPGFEAITWGAVLILILLVLVGNLTAILLRDKYQRRYRW